MTDNEPQGGNNSGDKPLGLTRPGRLELKKTVESGQVRQSFSHGRTKTVQVEKKKKRTFKRTQTGNMAEVPEIGIGNPVLPEGARAQGSERRGGALAGDRSRIPSINAGGLDAMFDVNAVTARHEVRRWAGRQGTRRASDLDKRVRS